MSEPQGREAELRLDAEQTQEALEQLRMEQRLGLGMLGGLVAALVGAGLWAVVTVVTGYQIGWMAIGVGFLVGISVRILGKGIDKVFGVVGAVLALLGCALGNLLAVCGTIAASENLSYLEVLSKLNPELVKEIMVASFNGMDMLFYGFALYEGFKLSFRKITKQDLAEQAAGVRID